MTFTASNGITVDSETQGITGWRRIAFSAPQTISDLVIEIPGPEMAALIEALDSEKDVDLGRWRWAEDTNYVVYPKPNKSVVVVDERSGWSEHIYGPVHSHYSKVEHWGAANAYFDAHPDPKPWHDAKEGEVWVFTTGEGTFPAFVETRIGEDGPALTFDSSTTEYALTDPDITAARRIWPEENPS